MTDNEIIKDLEREIEHNNGLAKRDALRAIALINRQKAEIERLSQPLLVFENNELSEKELVENMRKGSIGIIPESKCSVRRIDEQGIKAEAIKEFADRLKEAESYYLDGVPYEMIDNLVKEITEGREE